ncbi:hypothetical protein K0M31_006342 [Melipona bicolor]|uniref:Uncharacterized protein n=1 Tax=Melipona bicolor TaxID=60889 RepID=A0AA40KLN2_9HYME|nr:hypothetical protein K0M31_006342 [Melipona bicolor]
MTSSPKNVSQFTTRLYVIFSLRGGAPFPEEQTPAEKRNPPIARTSAPFVSNSNSCGESPREGKPRKDVDEEGKKSTKLISACIGIIHRITGTFALNSNETAYVRRQ